MFKLDNKIPCLKLKLVWKNTIDIQSEVIYFAVDRQLSEKIKAFARRRGVSPDTLLNLWVQEKLQEQNV